MPPALKLPLVSFRIIFHSDCSLPQGIALNPMPYSHSRPREITASTPSEQLVDLFSNVYGLSQGVYKGYTGYLRIE